MASKEVLALSRVANISLDEAQEIFDKIKARRNLQVDKVSGSVVPKEKVMTEELKEVLKTIDEKGFAEKSRFSSRDLAKSLEHTGLGPRQIPSRLKALTELGYLEDLGGSPKSFCRSK